MLAACGWTFRPSDECPPRCQIGFVWRFSCTASSFPSAALTTGRPSLATRHYSEPLLFGRSRVNLAALRTVKVAPGPLIRPSCKTCTIRISVGLTSACPKNTHPACRPSVWRHADLHLRPHCQRPSARSRHTEFTTRLPESSERLRNLVFSRLHKRDRIGVRFARAQSKDRQ